MDPMVWTALIAAVPATIAALASLKAARRVKTSNGKTSGQLLEHIYSDLTALRADFEHHRVEPASRAHRRR